MLDNLTLELVWIVLKALEVQSLCRVARLNHSYKAICDEQALWMPHLQKQLTTEPKEEQRFVAQELRTSTPKEILQRIRFGRQKFRIKSMPIFEGLDIYLHEVMCFAGDNTQKVIDSFTGVHAAHVWISRVSATTGVWLSSANSIRVVPLHIHQVKDFSSAKFMENTSKRRRLLGVISYSAASEASFEHAKQQLDQLLQAGSKNRKRTRRCDAIALIGVKNKNKPDNIVATQRAKKLAATNGAYYFSMWADDGKSVEKIFTRFIEIVNRRQEGTLRVAQPSRCTLL